MKIGKILITGGKGFLGKHVTNYLREHYKNIEIVSVGRDYADLRNYHSCKAMITLIRPTIVVNLAGKVGGITDNIKTPYDYFSDNMKINLNLFDIVGKNNTSVIKLINVIGGCSYPYTAISPINEDKMWEGYPQKESAAYSIAKKTILVMSEACKSQFNFNSITLIPGNMYGPFDDFSESGHIIPAVIDRMYKCKIRNETFYAYGDGEVYRDFIYVEDVAKCLPMFISYYDSIEPVNISSGVKTKLKSVIYYIAKLLDYNTDNIYWDTSKPVGMRDKIFDTTRFEMFLDQLNLPKELKRLDAGLEDTIKWYLNNIGLKYDKNV